MHSHTSGLSLLDEMSPRQREDITREAINSAFELLPKGDKKLIVEAVDSVKLGCTGAGIGDAGALELLAKLGIWFQSRTE